MCHSEKNSPAAQIKTGFWDAPRRESQSLEDITLLLHLLTSPDRSPIGMMHINWRITAARLKWDRLQVETILNRLHDQGELERNENWIFVKIWWDHNSIPGPGLKDRILPLLQEAPIELLDTWSRVTWEQADNKESWIFQIPLFTEFKIKQKKRPHKRATPREKTLGSTPCSTPSTTPGTTPPQNKSKKKLND